MLHYLWRSPPPNCDGTPSGIVSAIVRPQPALSRIDMQDEVVDGGLSPLPSSPGPPDNGNMSACLGRVRGDVRPVLSCLVLYMYAHKRVKEYCFLPAKQWDILFLGVSR